MALRHERFHRLFFCDVYNLNNLFKAKLNIQQTFVDVDIPKV